MGVLRGYDQTTNLILDEAHERVYSSRAGVEQVSGGRRGTRPAGDLKSRVYLRGPRYPLPLFENRLSSPLHLSLLRP